MSSKVAATVSLIGIIGGMAAASHLMNHVVPDLSSVTGPILPHLSDVSGTEIQMSSTEASQKTGKFNVDLMFAPRECGVRGDEIENPINEQRSRAGARCRRERERGL